MRAVVGLSLACCLIFFVVSGSVLALSVENADRLLNEAEMQMDHARSSRDLNLALRKSEDALKVFEAVGDANRTLKALRNLTAISEKRHEYRKALSFALRAVEQAKKTNNPEDEALATGNLAVCYSHLGLFQEAIAGYNKSLRIARDHSLVELQLHYSACLAALYAEWAQYGKAVELARQSVEAAKGSRKPQEQPSHILNLARILLSASHLDEAKERFEDALRRFQALNSREGMLGAWDGLFRVHSLLHDHQKALECLNECFVLAKEAGRQEEQIGILKDMAAMHMESGDCLKAKDSMLQALKKSELEGGDKSRSFSLQDQLLRDLFGVLLKCSGNDGMAIAEIAKAMRSVLGWSGISSPRTATEIAGSYYWWHLRQFGKAEQFFGQTIASARRRGNTNREASAQNNLGKLYLEWKRYDKAIGEFKESLRLSSDLGRRDLQAFAHQGIANTLVEFGHYDEALRYLSRALRLFRQQGIPMAVGGCLSDLGRVHELRGNYPSAEKEFEEALAIFKELGLRKDESIVLNRIANLHLSLGQYEKALQYVRRNRDSAVRWGDLQDKAQADANLAATYLLIGRYHDALRQYEKALSVMQKTRMTDYEKVLIGMGRIHLELGELGEAESLLNQTNDALSLALLALRRGDYPRAISYYESVYGAAKRAGDVKWLHAIGTGLGLAHEAQGHYAKAAESFLEVVKLTEDLRSGLKPSIRERYFEAKFAGFSRLEPYKGLARVLMKLNKPVEALKWSEYTKARTFSETLARRGDRNPGNLPSDVFNRDRELNEQIAALRIHLDEAKAKKDTQVITALEPLIAKAENRMAAHIESLRKEHPFYAATRYPRIMSLSESALRENEWLIAYDVSDKGILIYLTQGKDLKKGLFRPIAGKDLETLVKQYLDPLCNQELGSFDMNLGKRLADLLLTPVLGLLPESVPVTIVPDAALSLLPFEALVLDPAHEIRKGVRGFPEIIGGKFFVDRNPVCYAHSITAMTISRTQGKEPAELRRALVMADPVYDEKDPRARQMAQTEFRDNEVAAWYKSLNGTVRLLSSMERDGGGTQRLEGTALLASAIERMFPDTTVRMGFQATKSEFLNVLSPRLADYGSIIFATHGDYGSRLPGIMEPVLILTTVPSGTDGYLRMSEIMGLKLNADMVALTACQTGVGKHIAGEGTMGMGRAFQYAGARNVLMSLWPVHEDSSVKLVKYIFRQVKEGISKLEALHWARTEIRKDGYNHPFFWASFILVGDTPAKWSPSEIISRSLPKSQGRLDRTTIQDKSSADHNTDQSEISTLPVQGKEAALLQACGAGRLAEVKTLIASGAEVESRNDKGTTPLTAASWAGHVEVVKFLLKKGAKVADTDGRYISPLAAASINGHEDVVKTLLDAGAETDRMSGNGQVFALASAAEGGHQRVVKLLLDHGANVNLKNRTGDTAVIFAAYKGNVEVLRLLIRQGALIDSTNNQGLTPLMAAASAGHNQALQILIKASANADTADKNGQTPLVRSIIERRSEVAALLIKADAKVNRIAKGGMTALTAASVLGMHDTVKLLLEHGAEVNHMTDGRLTALMFAASRGDTRMVKLLLNGGADARATDTRGLTAAAMAEQAGHSETTNLLGSAVGRKE